MTSRTGHPSGPPRRNAGSARLAALHLALLGLLVPVAAGADAYSVGSEIEPFSIEDQHGKTHQLDASVEAVLFSRDMKGGDLIKAALVDVGPDFLEQRHAVYLADISGMPGLIARMFAIPKMRKRPYPMLLDRDGSLSEKFPDVEGEATVVSLAKLRVTAIQHFTTSDDLKRAVGIPVPSDEEDGGGAPAPGRP